MGGGDFILGHSPLAPVVLDMHGGAGNGAPTQDTTDNVQAWSLEAVHGGMRLNFTRQLSTGDLQDVDIASVAATTVLWAYANTASPSLLPQHTARGSRALMLGQRLTECDALSLSPPPPPSVLSPLTAASLLNSFSFVDGDFRLDWVLDPAAGVARFAMSKPGAAGWVALCLTDRPGLMGPGDTWVAWAATGEGFVASDRALSGGRASPATDAVQNLRRVGGALVNGRVTVFFERDLDTGDAADHAIRRGNTAVVWAMGADSPGGGAASVNAAVGSHSQTSTGAVRIDFFTGRTSIDYTRLYMIRAHVILMALAWLFLVPCSVVVARFCKVLLGAWWFRVHMTLGLLVLAATVAGFALGLLYSTEDFRGPNIAHKILGQTMLIVTIGQCLLGAVADRMWSPTRERVPVFPDRVHWWAGRLSAAGGLTNCVLGVLAFGYRELQLLAAIGAVVVIWTVSWMVLARKTRGQRGPVSSKVAPSEAADAIGDGSFSSYSYTVMASAAAGVGTRNPLDVLLDGGGEELKALQVSDPLSAMD